MALALALAVAVVAAVRRDGTMTAVRRTVEVNGVRLCTEAFGTPGAPAVLLLHGAGHSMLNWPDAFVRRLADGGRYVVRYDSRDAGRSTAFPVGAPPYGLRELASDAAHLIAALDLGRAHVVGMSQGSAVAQLLALDHPEVVATLTLTASTPGGPGHATPDLPPMAARIAALFEQEEPAVDRADREAVVRHLVEGERPFAAASRPFDADGMRRVAARTVDHAADIAAQLTNPFLIDAGAPWRHRLGGLAVPTLVCHGDEDPLFPPDHGRALAAEIPGAAFHLLERTGHEVFPPATWASVLPLLLDHTA
ncbi:alpha/beta fold hydrolase [Kitasatospora sp. NPDC096147]|uniref:alpha/beta fold hydrolase n=1 Tax=Kitasatospora sp. NPDC096147 TaxID=3364093 RepID=UPI00381B0184